MKTVDSSGNRIVVDTFAWIEYFRGSPAGLKAKNFIDGNFELFTPSIVIAELSDKYRREHFSEKWEKERKAFIELKSTIILLDSGIADDSGKIKNEKRVFLKGFGLADAMVLASAKNINGKILTGDAHLIGEKSAIDLAK